MHCMNKKNTVVFGGGRSSGVLESQNLKDSTHTCNRDVRVHHIFQNSLYWTSHYQSYFRKLKPSAVNSFLHFSILIVSKYVVNMKLLIFGHCGILVQICYKPYAYLTYYSLHQNKCRQLSFVLSRMCE